MHFYNAEVLLPLWIVNHASFFDEAILIDYHSTDHSVSVIHRTAPSSWRVVASKNEQQDFSNKTLVNEELLWYSKLCPEAWIITLEVSEFLVSTSLRTAINQRKNILEELQIPKLYASNQPDMSLRKLESSLLHKHSTVGMLSSNPFNHEMVGENVPPSVLGVYESTIGSDLPYRSIRIGSSTRNSSSASGESIKHLDESVLKDVFIIDYVWQTFDMGNGQLYCPLSNKINLDFTRKLSCVSDECCACSWYPRHLLDAIDLSDIHSHSHHDQPTIDVNVGDVKLQSYIKTYQDTMFASRLEFDSQTS